MGGEKKQDNIDSTNIFEEFSQDEELKSEVKSNQKQKEKWIHYYLWLLNTLLKSINIIFVLLFLVAGWYLYIQNNEEFNNISYLDPICSIFIDEKYIPAWESCSSAASLAKKYNESNADLSNKYYAMIANAIEDVYYVSNFTFSKEILFLLDKTENRLSPLSILSDFDKLKNEFEPINKWKLVCFNILIEGDGTLSVECDAYSSYWDTNIVWIAWINDETKKVSWTSISVASSFINYIEKNSKIFTIIDKQKEFTYSDVINYWWYSRKTNFSIKMTLRSNNLSLK